MLYGTCMWWTYAFAAGVGEVPRSEVEARWDVAGVQIEEGAQAAADHRNLGHSKRSLRLATRYSSYRLPTVTCDGGSKDGKQARSTIRTSLRDGMCVCWGGGSLIP